VNNISLFSDTLLQDPLGEEALRFAASNPTITSKSDNEQDNLYKAFHAFRTTTSREKLDTTLFRIRNEADPTGKATHFQHTIKDRRILRVGAIVDAFGYHNDTDISGHRLTKAFLYNLCRTHGEVSPLFSTM
jgi:hypothetical protein